MTAARVDALVSGVKAACGYRRAVRVPASMQEVLDLAEIVRDLAEEKLVLLRVIDSQAREIEQLRQGES